MIMTKYEFNLIISQRTVQLSQGHPAFVDVEKILNLIWI